KKERKKERKKDLHYKTGDYDGDNGGGVFVVSSSIQEAVRI
ncbi:MAG: hypothetical protein ACI9RU_001544, partial [Litorivivens sp.]